MTQETQLIDSFGRVITQRPSFQPGQIDYVVNDGELIVTMDASRSIADVLNTIDANPPINYVPPASEA